MIFWPNYQLTWFEVREKREYHPHHHFSLSLSSLLLSREKDSFFLLFCVSLDMIRVVVSLVFPLWVHHHYHDFHALCSCFLKLFWFSLVVPFLGIFLLIIKERDRNLSSSLFTPFLDSDWERTWKLISILNTFSLFTSSSSSWTALMELKLHINIVYI